MALPLTTRVRQAERTAARTIEGKAVLVVIDEKKLHVLNGVGTCVWDLADGRTLEEVIAGVVTRYAVTAENAERDVRAFVEELRSVGAVELEP